MRLSDPFCLGRTQRNREKQGINRELAFSYAIFDK
jgi:hypothetical protein